MTKINLITGAFIFLLGIIIKHGKMYNLIAGYNTMPRDKKKNFDINGFSTLLRDCFIMIGFIIITGNSLFKWLGMPLLSELIIGISTVLILPILLIGGQKYNLNNSPEKIRKNQKVIFIVYIAFLAILISIFIFEYQI